MVPDGWRVASVDAVCETVSVGIVVNPSHYYVAENEGTRAFRSGNVRENGIIDGKWVYISQEGHTKNRKSELRAGDVLVVRTGFAGTACVLPAHYAGANCIDILFARPDQTQVLPEYLAQLTNSEVGRRQILAGQSGLAQKHLNVATYAAMQFGLPPVPEQRQIAAILSTWDAAIATAERLSYNIQAQGSELTRILLSGRKRLGAYRPWSNKRLSELIVESRIVGSGGHLARKLTVKLYGKGVVEKREKRVGSESTVYYRRAAGQFIYSKLDFLNGAFGCVPLELDGYESTLDLPAFDFLPGVEPRWFLHFVSREDFYLDQLGLANGGRKARRVNPADLLKVSIVVPSIEEQRAIADAIDLSRAQLKAALRRAQLLRDEKSVLMAQLLTGKRRVRLCPIEATA